MHFPFPQNPNFLILSKLYACMTSRREQSRWLTRQTPRCFWYLNPRLQLGRSRQDGCILGKFTPSSSNGKKADSLINQHRVKNKLKLWAQGYCCDTHFLWNKPYSSQKVKCLSQLVFKLKAFWSQINEIFCHKTNTVKGTSYKAGDKLLLSIKMFSLPTEADKKKNVF